MVKWISRMAASCSSLIESYSETINEKALFTRGYVFMSYDPAECEVDLSKYSAGDYHPGSLVKRVLWLWMSRCFFETWFPWPSSLKSKILRALGAEIGAGVVWKPCVKIKYPWFLKVGDHSWIGEHAWIDNLAQVEILNNVVISQGAYLLTGNHDYKSRDFDLRIGPILIEAGAWVGAKSIVCPGVTLKKMSVLAVGAIATQNLEPYGIYSGNPAEKVREREVRLA